MIDLLNSDARRIPLADQSVQCIITSPPYWGLRDYGTATWQGGDPKCMHIAENRPQRGHNGHDFGDIRGDELSKTATKIQYRDTCAKCGAIRIDAQIGLERMPDCLGWATGKPCGQCYVCHIVAVMRECWRVLRDDGVCWLNLGDSYASGEIGRHDGYNPTRANGSGTNKPFGRRQQTKLETGLKPKDLCMIPARVALALQADGWYLRNEVIEKVELYCPCGCGYILEEKIWRYSQDRDIIWHKPNPMPESVTDRPTKTHEMIYLLTKEPRYYYDAEAIKEPHETLTNPKYASLDKTVINWKDRPNNGDGRKSGFGHMGFSEGGRNRRSVWTVATSPYSGAHFAAFPPALVEPMILAGTSARGACPTCGKAWVRVIEKEYKGSAKVDYKDRGASRGQRSHNSGDTWRQWEEEHPDLYLGWRPTCSCYDVPPLPDEPDDTSNGNMTAYRAERARLLDLYDELPTVPCIVLDPFAGSGTVGKVAVKHGRRFVGCELNREYIELAFERTSKVQTVMQL